MYITDTVIMLAPLTLLVWTIWCGCPVHGQIRKDFDYLTRRPAEGSELFRIRADTEPACVNVCVQNEHCQALLHEDTECVGYRNGAIDGGDLAGAVALQVIGK